MQSICAKLTAVDFNKRLAQSSNLQAYGDDGENEYQYFNCYKHRLEMLKPRLEITLNEQFSNIPVKSLLEINDDEPAIVIGIFLKKYKKQDQILNEYREDDDESTPDGEQKDIKLITGLFST